jgi:hypothetical protein
MALRQVFHQESATDLITRCQQQMHVVGHKAVRVHRATEPRRIRSKCDQVCGVVVLVEEDSSSVMSPLDDMQGDVRYDDAAGARHSPLNGACRALVDFKR